MKNILFFLILVCVALSGCDGKDRIHLSNTQILKTHKLLDSFSKNIKYFPEKYSETKVDTLLATGIRVHIKTFTDMKTSCLNTFKVNNIENKHYYRNNKAAITITFKSIIFKKILDKNFFLSNDASLQGFFKAAILQGVWLNQEESKLNSYITLDATFCKPKTKKCKHFKLIVNKNGSYKIIKT